MTPSRPTSPGVRRARLLAAAGGLALLAPLAAGPLAGALAERSLRAALPGATWERVRVGAAGLVIEGLALERDGGALRVRRAHLAGASPLAAWASPPWATPALAANETFALDDATYTSGTTTLRAKRLEVSGGDRASVLAVLDARDARPLSQRLGALAFTSASAPEVEVIQAPPLGPTTRAVYRDVRARDAKDGRVGAVEAAGADFKGSAPPPARVRADRPNAPERASPARVTFEGTVGPLRVAALDLAVLARFQEGASPGEAPVAPRPAYASYTIERLDLGAVPADGGTVRVGVEAIQGGALELGVPALAPARLAALLAARPNVENAPLAERREVFGGVLALGEMVRTAPAEARGLTLKGLTPRPAAGERAPAARAPAAGRPAGGDQAVDMVVARMTTGGFKDWRFESFGVEGMSVTVPDGSMRLAGFSVRGLDVGDLMRALAATGADPEALSALDPRKALPRLDGFTVTGIEADLPQGQRPAGARQPAPGERARFGLGRFEVALANYVGGVPTRATLALDNLTTDVPPAPRGGGDTFTDLRALGYQKVDLGARLGLGWDEATGTLKVDELTATGANMGAARLTATLGNVPRELFTGDQATATVAALGAVVRGAELRVENGGLVDRLIEREAKRGGRKPEEVRRDYGAGAAMLIPSFFGDDPAGKTVANAVARFIAQPKTFRVEATAKGEGLGAADFAAARAPTDVLAKINLKAAANE